jgi:catechol 2,3-dioxygenase
MHRAVGESSPSTEPPSAAVSGPSRTGAELAGVLDSDTHVATVSLTVSNVPRVAAFYEEVLGLSSTRRDDGRIILGADGGPGLVELRGDGSALSRDPASPGLFHLALLMPDRRQLAMSLARLAAGRWPLDGASDHLVSEALYLSDPEGNGIEIYRDRPREDWPERDGSLVMATLPLDLENVLAELGDATQVEPHAPAGTTIGHVHLQVSDLVRAEEFYVGVLGFEVTVRAYPGALFVSAGGYHHHLGLNTWHSAGSPPAPAGAAGLRSFEVVVPSTDELQKVLRRIGDASLEVSSEAGGHLARDPFGNGVLLRVG